MSDIIRLTIEHANDAADLHRKGGALIPGYDTSLHKLDEYRVFYSDNVMQKDELWGIFDGNALRGFIALLPGWTDHLLWHHAAHTIDLFAYQAGPIVKANAIEGPIHPELGIAMDMSIQLMAESGAICTLSLSFNNDGPLGTFFRYTVDNATYIARYDDLVNGKEEPIDVSAVDVSMNVIELQDREFIAAIRDGREPNSSVQQVLPCYKVAARFGAAILSYLPNDIDRALIAAMVNGKQNIPNTATNGRLADRA